MTSHLGGCRIVVSTPACGAGNLGSIPSSHIFVHARLVSFVFFFHTLYDQGTFQFWRFWPNGCGLKFFSHRCTGGKDDGIAISFLGRHPLRAG